MGALCGKESSDHFSTPGRTLASAPPPQTTSSVPAQRKVGGPPRTLGSASDSGTATTDRPVDKAREAALQRAESSRKPTGRLGQNVIAGKSKSMKKTQEDTSMAERQQKALSENTKNLLDTQN